MRQHPRWNARNRAKAKRTRCQIYCKQRRVCLKLYRKYWVCSACFQESLKRCLVKAKKAA